MDKHILFVADYNTRLKRYLEREGTTASHEMFNLRDEVENKLSFKTDINSLVLNTTFMSQEEILTVVANKIHSFSEFPTTGIPNAALT